MSYPIPNDSYFASDFGGNGLVTHPEVFSLSYTPQILPGREAHLAELKRRWLALQGDGFSGRPYRVILSGKSGVGKTALAVRFSRDLMVGSYFGSFRRVVPVFVDVINARTDYAFLKTVWNGVKFFGENRFINFKNMQAELVRYLNGTSTSVLLRVEHGEALMSSRRSGDLEGALLDIFGSQEVLRRVGVILTTNSPLLSSDVSAPQMELQRYGKDQMVNIVGQRLSEGLVENGYDEPVVDLVAESAEGNATKAIGALNALTNEAIRKRPDRITLAFAEEVLGRNSSSYFSFLNDMSKHERIFLLALARTLKAKGEKMASTSEVENAYKALCSRYGELPKKHTTFWTMMNSLSGLGVIGATKSGKGMRGKTTIISLKDVNPEDMASEIERMMHS